MYIKTYEITKTNNEIIKKESVARLCYLLLGEYNIKSLYIKKHVLTIMRIIYHSINISHGQI